MHTAQELLQLGKESFESDNSNETMKAFAFFIQAAELGKCEAYYYLSRIVSQGIGVPSNSQLADKYLLKASDSGVQGATFELLVNTFNNSDVVDETYSKIKSLATNGHEASAYWLEDDYVSLAICYLEGDGVLCSKEVALKWLIEALKSITEETAPELLAVIDMFEKLPPEVSEIVENIQNKYESSEYCLEKAWDLFYSQQDTYRSQAFSWFKTSVVKGNYRGLKGMAKCYAEGIGCDKNDLEANRLLHRLASVYEDIDASYDLALRLDDGVGRNQASNEFGNAKEWYQFAGLRGHIQSACNALEMFDILDKLLNRNLYKKLLQVAIKSENPQLYYEYSLLISNHTPSQSKKYLLKAAQGGSVEAMFDIGQDKINRKSMLQEGLNWLQCAGERNHPGAAYKLGVYYSSSLEETKNNIEIAVKWLELAAKQDHTDAMYHLGNCYMYKLEYTEERSNIAINWYHQAAKNEHADAIFELGWAYKNGYGVTVDYIKARQWFQKAAQFEGNSAGKELEELDRLVWDFYKNNK
ncbi:tetratricopeptide repeat protein [Photobacterium leiognathi]|uniref:tetratricopeptide repeat protein n=1 Tax=Photobacterium leiognathi TaxID=553611 RepID=UPI002980B011|nr:hypothetical protein [Photobacterium leiognathi]